MSSCFQIYPFWGYLSLKKCLFDVCRKSVIHCRSLSLTSEQKIISLTHYTVTFVFLFRTITHIQFFLRISTQFFWVCCCLNLRFYWMKCFGVTKFSFAPIIWNFSNVYFDYMLNRRLINVSIYVIMSNRNTNGLGLHLKYFAFGIVASGLMENFTWTKISTVLISQDYSQPTCNHHYM